MKPATKKSNRPASKRVRKSPQEASLRTLLIEACIIRTYPKKAARRIPPQNAYCNAPASKYKKITPRSLLLEGHPEKRYIRRPRGLLKTLYSHL